MCLCIQSPLISIFQRFDVDLLHFKHRLHHASGFLLVAVMQHIDKHRWDDLPRKTKFVPEPAARGFLTTVCGEFLPKIIHFSLTFAVYDEGYGFIEFEKRPAVKGDELLTFDLEFDCQN